MTGISRCPRRVIACSAGKIFLYASSPVAPKKTERVSTPGAHISEPFGSSAPVPNNLDDVLGDKIYEPRPAKPTAKATTVTIAMAENPRFGSPPTTTRSRRIKG
jgi:hypothetical protein